MDNRYGGFNKGINGDISAANYFDSLPLEVKEELNRWLRISIRYPTSRCSPPIWMYKLES